MHLRNVATLVIVAASVAAYVLRAAASEKIDCELRFNLSGWAVVVKHAVGDGTITCSNGQSIDVHINAIGGGLTAGKYKVDNGKGKFAGASSIEELLGHYVQGEANAGLIESGTAQVLTKGTSSLALSGTGEGIDWGISIGSFEITRAK